MSVRALSDAMALRGVSPTEKLLLLALANYADENATCYPSQRRLADETCLSDRTVRTLLAALEARGLITRQERQRQDGSRATDLITLHIAPAQISGGAEAASGGVRKELPGGAEAASGLTTFEPSLNHQPEPDDDDASAPDWNARLEEARKAGGDGLDLTATSLHSYRDLRTLCEPRSGEPCLWDEVLEAIKVRAAKVQTHGPKIRSWTWVHEQALSFRDRRLAGLRAPEVAPGRTIPAWQQQADDSRAIARQRILADG